MILDAIYHGGNKYLIRLFSLNRFPVAFESVQRARHSTGTIIQLRNTAYTISDAIYHGGKRCLIRLLSLNRPGERSELQPVIR